MNVVAWPMADRLLFACSTPLHLMIVEQILKRIPLNQVRVDLALFEVSRPEQLAFYLERVSHQLDDIVRIDKTPRFPFYAYELWRKFSGRKYAEVYIPNPAAVRIQFLLSYCTFRELRTFDDGSANIDRDSLFYTSRNTSLEVSKRTRLTHLVYAALGRRYDTQRLISMSKRHYTIYRGMPNIVANVEAVSLFEPNWTEKSSSTDQVFIFLGTVIEEIARGSGQLEKLKKRVQAYIDTQAREKTVLYLSHPRETDPPFVNIQVCETLLTAEDYIISKLSAGTKVTVAGFSNSTQFALVGLPNLVQTCFVSSLLPEASFKRAVMLEREGVEIVRV